MKEDIKKFVKCCPTCNKVKAGKKLVNVGNFEVPEKRFSHIMVDLVGPLPESYGYRFLLTVICRTTRYLHCIPLREASASAAATGFLHGWLAHFGVPAVVSSDQGGSFTAALWKEMMKTLHVDIKYSALYRPQGIGLLERQHRSIKDSLKAAIEDMVDKHQGRWMDHLPWVLMGRRNAVQPDIGASPSELAFGMGMRIPGQILNDPGDPPTTEELGQLLERVRTGTNRSAKQTSDHSKPEPKFPEIPAHVTHVYTKQHKAQGLQTPYEGPFLIESRPSRSTVRIEVGQYKSGEKRYEIRHFNDLKIAHPDSLAAPATRPKLGRPTTVQSKGQNATEAGPNPPVQQTGPPPFCFGANPSSLNPLNDGNKNNIDHATSNSGKPAASSAEAGNLKRPIRSTRNPAPQYIDAFQWSSLRPWSASSDEIAALKDSITRNVYGL